MDKVEVEFTFPNKHPQTEQNSKTPQTAVIPLNKGNHLKVTALQNEIPRPI